MADKLLQNIESQMGQYGCDVINDTAEHTPANDKMVYAAVNFLADSVISTYLVDSKAPVNGSLAGMTIAAGSWIFGKFTSIKLTSGRCVAYRGEK